MNHLSIQSDDVWRQCFYTFLHIAASFQKKGFIFPRKEWLEKPSASQWQVQFSSHSWVGSIWNKLTLTLPPGQQQNNSPWPHCVSAFNPLPLFLVNSFYLHTITTMCCVVPFYYRDDPWLVIRISLKRRTKLYCWLLMTIKHLYFIDKWWVKT